MRILAACDWFSPETGGGAERVAWEIYRRLAADGHQIVVVATAPPGRTFAASMDGNLTVVAVPAHNLAPLLRAQISVARGLGPAFGRAVRALRPDVIHGHSLQFQTTPAAAAAARRAGLPLVLTAHIGDLRAVSGWLGVAARTHERYIGARALRSATRAIAVSDPVAVHLRSLVPALPIDVVPNGVDLARFRPKVGVRRAGPVRLGLIGRLVPNKGPSVAVRVAASLREAGRAVELIIVGDGPLYGAVAAEVGRLGLTGVVTFAGYQADMPAVLSDIDILLRPSLTEGMPLSLLEAMAVGVPIIATDIPGNASLISHEETGLLVPIRDVAAMATAVARLIDQPATVHQLTAQAQRLAADHTWEATAAGTLRSLETAISDHVVTTERRSVA